MKTMLKTNLVRMGFFGPGLFLLMPITGLRLPDNNSKETNVAGFQSRNLVDTAIADRMDSAILMASTSADFAKSSEDVPAIQLNKHVTSGTDLHQAERESRCSLFFAR